MVFKQGARFFDELTSFQKGGMLFGKRWYAFGKLQTAFADCRQSCPSVSVLPVEHYWNMY